MVEGIKAIKLYGWEMAFKDIIQTIREREIVAFFKLKMVKSVLAITKEVSIYLVAFLWFWIIFVWKEGDGLSTGIILAAIQPIVVLNDGLVHCGNTITMLYTLEVILERFVNIMNTQNCKL